jgi:predicted DsbA family dithiol-disulfide isomerase
MDVLRLVAWSDYLCPWCYNGSVRLRQLEQEYDGRVELEFRSFLLRPRPEPGRDLEKFRRYTRSWERPAAESDSGQFRVWEGNAGPPSHSIPPAVVAKAAATLGDTQFRAMHDRLLRAYFTENLDISADETLEALWKELGLDADAFARREDPALLQLVLDEHNAAVELGVTGVPTVMIDGQNVPITGAHPLSLYRRWLDRALGGEIPIDGRTASRRS